MRGGLHFCRARTGYHPPVVRIARRRAKPWPSTGEGMRVLLVEDEERLAMTIARGLRHEGMAVEVVLDRNLPVVHGDDVCRELVARQSLARILMLTAAGSIQDRVTGLNLGADDYLPKPF